MKTAVAAAFAAVAMLAASHAAAQVVFYEHQGLHGRSFAVNGAVDNFASFGFNDTASSVIIQRGRWEVCENAGFRGRCIVLSSGQYPSLEAMGMNNRISSVRPIGNRPYYAYTAPPPAPAPYPYYPRYGETLYTADVVAVRAVVGSPEQRCWVEQQQVVAQNQPNIGGAIVGGVLGGVIGHQIGGGRGNDVATAVGAVGGAVVGSNVNRGTQVGTQNIQRCEAVPGTAKPEYWDVTYLFRGQTHRAQLATDPGATITVNERGEPRM